MSPLRVLALEPWLGGSHERFLDRWRARSSHGVTVAGLPARHWRWRMGAGAWGLAEVVRDQVRPDLLFASDYVDVPRLLGHLPAHWRDLPVLLYFHENQLTYPAAPEAESSPGPFAGDVGPALTNVLSAVAATRVVFNSNFHRADLLQAGDALLGRLPKPRPRAAFRAALEAADVIGPGIELAELPLGTGPPPGSPLRVAFPHRWEHDKDPAGFLSCVQRALQAGAELELVLLGERYDRMPAGVGGRLDELAPAIRHSGYAESREDYARLLGGCDVVASTAKHEFYGLALLEGLATGALPLAPRRLSYPEILGPELHGTSLYGGPDELVSRLVQLARDPGPLRSPAARERLRAFTTPHAAERSAQALDALCLACAESKGA